MKKDVEQFSISQMCRGNNMIIWDSQNQNGDCYYLADIDDLGLQIQVNYYGKQSFELYIEKFNEPIVEKEIVNWTVLMKYINKYINMDSELPPIEDFRKMYNAKKD